MTRLIDTIRRYGLTPYAPWTMDDAHQLHQTLNDDYPVVAIDNIAHYLFDPTTTNDPITTLNDAQSFLTNLPDCRPIFSDAFYETCAGYHAVAAWGCLISVIDLWQQMNLPSGADDAMRNQLARSELTRVIHQQSLPVSPWEPWGDKGVVASDVRWVIDCTLVARYRDSRRVVYGPTGVIALALTPNGTVARSLTNHPVLWGPKPDHTLGLLVWCYAPLIACTLMRRPDVLTLQIQLDPAYIRTYRKRTKQLPTPFHALIVNPSPSTQTLIDQQLPPPPEALALHHDWMRTHLWTPNNQPTNNQPTENHQSPNATKSGPRLIAGNG